MTLILWIVDYLLDMAFWLWIALWGGAEWLNGTWLMNFFVHAGASEWEPESTKLVAWFFIFSTTFWFILGLVDPKLQFYPMPWLMDMYRRIP